MIPEQQRFWIALLNLQRTWTTDRAALSFIPPRHRDFTSRADWPQDRAQAFLLNNLELLRESHALLEGGQALEFDLINHVLEGLTLHLQPWPNTEEVQRAAQAKAELGGRLEVLQARASNDEMNPGTRYIRSTVQRAFYYFAQYIDDRLSDPMYPEVSPQRWHVRLQQSGSGDLELVPPAQSTGTES